MVSKRERLEAAIAGEVADRPPVALWRHFPVDDQDPARQAEAHLHFQRTFDFDFLKVTPASSFCLRDWGVQDEWRGETEGTRTYTGRVVREPEDWSKLEPLEVTEGSLGAQLACLERLRDALGDEAPFIQTVFSPLAQARNLAGEECLLEHLHREPAAVEAGLHVITETTVRFIEAARQRGISGIFYAVQHASYRSFDEAGYARFGELYDRRILEAADGLWLNVLHLHGEALIFGVAERLPAAVVNWHDRDAGPSLKEAQGRVRGAVCGGLRRSATLVLGDPDQVLQEAREALASVGRRGVVLGAGCVTPITAPFGNLMAARRAVEA